MSGVTHVGAQSSNAMSDFGEEEATSAADETKRYCEVRFATRRSIYHAW